MVNTLSFATTFSAPTLYQKPEDAAFERAVGDFLLTCFNDVDRYVQTDKTHPVDLILLNPTGTARFVVEVKRRNYRQFSVDDFFIDYSKIRCLHKYRDQYAPGALPALAIQWNDRLVWHVVRPPASYDTGEIGRYDRGDRYDIDKGVHIPHGDFRILMEGRVGCE